MYDIDNEMLILIEKNENIDFNREIEKQLTFLSLGSICPPLGPFL